MNLNNNVLADPDGNEYFSATSVGGHLPITEELCEPPAVCSSQDFDSLSRAGIDLGERFSDVD